jgi:hypothetical protein
MSIYPILKGQQFDHKNAIPPRHSPSEPKDRQKEPNGEGGGDLIDIGDDKATAPPPQPSSEEQGQGQNQEQNKGYRPPIDPSHNSTSEIQEMLSSTGSRTKEGPLIDFHEDMKKDLPGSSIKRTNTAESEDEFVDAQG